MDFAGAVTTNAPTEVAKSISDPDFPRTALRL
jgi:hypothetical protein